MKSDRRNFLKSATAIGAGVTISPAIGKASPENVLSEDRMGILVDTTVCIGCRHCEWACRKSHDLNPGELDSYANKDVFKKKRHPNENELCVINECKNKSDDNKTYVKYQCMHCDKPACVSACIVGAITKQKNGSVIWDTDKCIGCRYCMVACPFQVPAFEYDVALKPDIKKCDLCFARTAQGYLPACIEICPMEVMTLWSTLGDYKACPRGEYVYIPKDIRIIFMARTKLAELLGCI